MGAGKDVELKTVTLSLLAGPENRSSESRPYACATWELKNLGDKKGGITIHMILANVKTGLAVETITIFTDTPGVNGRDIENFKKK